MQSGAGDDFIFVDSLPANIPVTIQAGLGNDTINIGDGDVRQNIFSNIFVEGEVGIDRLNINDSQAIAGADDYTIDGYQFTKDNSHFIRMDTSVESEYITGSPNNDVVSLISTPATALSTFDGRNGNDSVYLSNGDLSTFANEASIIGGAGNDAVYIVDDSRPTANSYELFNGTASAGGFFIADWDTTVESIVLNASPNNDDIMLIRAAADRGHRGRQCGTTPSSLPLITRAGDGRVR